MKMSNYRAAVVRQLMLLCVIGASWCRPAAADAPAALPATASPTAAVTGTDLERRIDALAADVERLRLGDAARPTSLTSKYGLGPAASKVYGQTGGVSIGGYGEMLYRNVLGEPGKDSIDFVRNVLYIGYKFDDKWVANAEIEVEHGNEIYLEFGYVDYLLDPRLNLRAGLLLVPMGLISELHEPTTILTATRPEVETQILPSTWRENGAGIFGEVGPVSYRAYVLNGMNAKGFTSGGLRGGRQKGIVAKAEDFAGVLRLDYTGVPGLMVGGSVYYGGADQDQLGATQVSNFIVEGHLDAKWRGFDVRALYARAATEGAAAVNKALSLKSTAGVAEVAQGFYAQLGYDIMTLLDKRDVTLSPFARFEQIDTQSTMPTGYTADPTLNRSIWALGAAFAPISQLIIKAEYQLRDHAATTAKPGDQIFVQLGYIY